MPLPRYRKFTAGVFEFAPACSSVLLCDVKMLTDEEKKQAQLMQKANPDLIYLNDVNILVSHLVVACTYSV